MFCVVFFEMLTAIIIVARVQPGTSKGITDLLLPQPSSGLKEKYSGPSSFIIKFGLFFLLFKGNKRLRSRSLPSELIRNREK